MCLASYHWLGTPPLGESYYLVLCIWLRWCALLVLLAWHSSTWRLRTPPPGNPLRGVPEEVVICFWGALAVGAHACSLPVFSQQLILSKVSLCSQIILLLQQSFLVLERNGKLLNQILPKVSILAKISFTTILNTLCKTFPMLLVDFNAPFHSDYICLIRSHIL